MVNKTALTIIVSIILTVILISLVNVGTSLVIDRPEYNDFCAEADLRYEPVNRTEGAVRKLNEDYDKCNTEFREAQKPYNQYRYYIFAGIGFLLLLTGLFFKENLIQLVGLAGGGILVAEGIVINLDNKLIVFISLLAILVIFGIVAGRVIKSK